MPIFLEDVKAGHLLSITVSIGISTYQEGDTAKTVIDRADRAFYIAKHAGKNRVVSENELTSAMTANANGKFAL